MAIITVGGLVAVAVAMTANDEESKNSRGPSPGSIGDPEVRQAKWKFTVKRASGKKLSNKEKAALRRQRKKLKTMTQDIFDALFLSPEKRDKALRTNFTVKARKSFQRSGAGVPKGADDVRIRRRSAWIVMDETARATMSVRVIARGQAKESPFATMNRSVLYVARVKGDWKVFGYEVDQHPIKKKATGKSDRAKEKRNTSPKDGKRDKKKGKKKRSGDRNRRGDRS